MVGACARLEEGLNQDTIFSPATGRNPYAIGDATRRTGGLARDDKVEPVRSLQSQAIGDKWLVTEGLKARRSRSNKLDCRK